MTIEDTSSTNTDSFPCMQCQQGTVIYKSSRIVECQNCFATMVAPQREHTTAIEIDAEPLLTGGVMPAPAGPIQLIDARFDSKRPTFGGWCTQCGQFFAWQRVAVVCPGCQSTYRAAPFRKAAALIFGLVSLVLFAGGIALLLLYDGIFIPAFGLLLNGGIFLIVTIVLLLSAYVHDQQPLIDSRLLTADELARLALSSQV